MFSIRFFYLLKTINKLSFLLLIFLYGCGGSGGSDDTPPISIAVQFQGAGKGNVSSFSSNISCSATCNTSVNQNSSSITLTATPKAGSTFSGWQGDCQGTSNCVLDTQTNHVVIAVFAASPLPPITMSVSFNGNGSGTVISDPQGINCRQNCTASFPQSSGTINFLATPDNNSVFTGWSGDCGSGTNCLVDSSANRNIVAIFSRNDDPFVDSVSLINADTNQPIANFDPLGPTNDLRIDQLPTENLNIRVNTSGTVDSVSIMVDDNDPRVENKEPYSLGDNGGNFNNWSLTPGLHQIIVTPYSQDNTQGLAGKSLEFSVNIIQDDIDLSSNKIDFVNLYNSSTFNAKILTLSNTGNTQINYSLENIPSWLTITPTNGVIPINNSVEFNIQADTCSTEEHNAGTMNILANTFNKTVYVSRTCSQATSLDFSLDKFYIFQAVPSMNTAQNVSDRVNLVANREGLGRAFVSSNRSTTLIPEVFFNYRLPNGNTGKINLTAPSSLSTTVNARQLENTYNSIIAKDLLVDGIELFIEIDPYNTIAEIDETNNRFPESGYFRPPVDTVNIFEVTIVPITYNGDALRDTSVQRFQTLLETTRKLYPLTNIDIKVHSPLLVTDASWGEMLRQVANLRRAEGSRRAYHGIIRQSTGNGTAGIGYVGGLSAVSIPSSRTIAHEFGHNFGLPHAPCGNPNGPDANFPYPNARIGVIGYDLIRNTLIDPNRADIMSYCRPSWISDYNYKKVARNRTQASTQMAMQLASTAPDSVLVVTGSVESEILSIHSVFSLTTASIEHQQGPYTLRGFDSEGHELFSQSFNAYELSHEAVSHFNVSVGLSQSELNELQRIDIYQQGEILATQQASSTLTIAANNPNTVARATVINKTNNTVEIVWNHHHFDAVMVRDPINNEVLGSDQSGRLLVQPQGDRVEMIYSDGLRSHNKVLTIK